MCGIVKKATFDIIINIPTRLRGFPGSIFGDERNLKILQFWLKNLGAMLEY